MLDQNLVARLPKVELHLHLEGAIPIDTLWALVEKYGATTEVATIADLEERFRYTDFPHFLQTWMWKQGFLREYDDLELVARSVAEDLARQNVRYVEAFFSPGDLAMLHGLEVQKVAEAVARGIRGCAANIEVRLIADLTRDFGPERGMRWLHELAEVRDAGILGIGLGGSEQDFPADAYADVYERARTYGLRTTAHAGEAAGPESVWAALRALRVDRIGHGTRAVEDPRLIDYLGERRIPLEMCPISNLRTGVVRALSEHPIGDFYRKGLLISVNTDDPKMFQTSLEQEFRALAEAHRLGIEDVGQLTRNAIASAWCPESKKRALAEELEAACRWPVS